VSLSITSLGPGKGRILIARARARRTFALCSGAAYAIVGSETSHWHPTPPLSISPAPGYSRPPSVLVGGPEEIDACLVVRSPRVCLDRVSRDLNRSTFIDPDRSRLLSDFQADPVTGRGGPGVLCTRDYRGPRVLMPLITER